MVDCDSIDDWVSLSINWHSYMSRCTTKPTKWLVRPAKTQISLGIRPVWAESSLFAWRHLWTLATYWAHSEDSDQTGQMPRLIWVFAGRTGQVVGFVVRSYMSHIMRKPVFWVVWPDKIQTGLLIYRSEQECWILDVATIVIKLHELHHEKTCFCHMRTTKVQISLRIRAVWSVLCYSLLW